MSNKMSGFHLENIKKLIEAHFSEANLDEVYNNNNLISVFLGLYFSY